MWATIACDRTAHREQLQVEPDVLAKCHLDDIIASAWRDCLDRAHQVAIHYDRSQANRAGAESGKGGASVNLHRVQDRAGVGLDAAAERAEKLGLQVLVDLDDVQLAGDRVRGE